ncbi:MAG TPA: hypothetical protein VFL29_01645 [Candidatus Dormibacteraeota bacterium]|nr:hypothetical protein [Candidatus Dormibacteraeota bacterium]
MATTISTRHNLARRLETEATTKWHTAAYAVSGLLAAVSTAAAAATFFVPDVLRGPAVMNGSARGTAIVMLVAGVPLLLCSMLFAARGSLRAQIVWLGAAGYSVYNGVMFVLATPFNQLYLLYEGMLGLSIWTAVLVVLGIDRAAYRRAFSESFPDRRIAGYLLTVTAANTFLWLSGVVPAVFSTDTPKFLEGTGLTTMPTYDQDLAFWLPSIAVAAIWMWRRMLWGRLLVGATLVMWVVEAVGVAVDQWMGGAADPASTVASASISPMFAALAVIGCVPLFFFMRGLRDREVAK